MCVCVCADMCVDMCLCTRGYVCGYVCVSMAQSHSNWISISLGVYVLYIHRPIALCTSLHSSEAFHDQHLIVYMCVCVWQGEGAYLYRCVCCAVLWACGDLVNTAQQVPPVPSNS